MNERIEQLAEQCWVHTNEPLFGAKSPHWEFDRQKFAELIVRECSDILRTEANSNWEGREERLLNAMANWIEQHFGVEE